MKELMLGTLHSISRDLKELLREAQDENLTLFVSETNSAHFPSTHILPPPRTSSVSSAGTNKQASKPKTTPIQPAPVKAPPSEVASPSVPVQKKPDITQEAAPLKKEEPPGFFVLEPLPALDTPNFSDRGSLIQRIQKLFPAWKLVEHPASDEEAIRIASAWKVRATTTEIIVLLFSAKPLIRTFLHNFAGALQRSIAPTQLIDARQIEQNYMWETILNAPCLKTIYAPPIETWHTPHLLTHVKTIPATGEHFLGKCRLHILQDFEVYLNSPEQKRLLWQQVCNWHQL